MTLYSFLLFVANMQSMEVDAMPSLAYWVG